jgi:hypothetical protein
MAAGTTESLIATQGDLRIEAALVETAAADAEGGRSGVLWWVAVALVLVPFVVSALVLIFGVGGRYLPAADQALITMHTRDVGSGHSPLVGLYSRGDWSHPGPMEFYVLAPFYRLAGGRAIGVYLGALAINAAAVVGLAVVARRRGGLPLVLLTLLGTTLMLRTLGADFARDPWNCFITTVPYALLVLLAWSMWCGEVWALPWAAAVGTFLAQTHVGFALLAPPLVLWGVVGLALAARRHSRETAADPAASDAPAPAPDPDPPPPVEASAVAVDQTGAGGVVAAPVTWRRLGRAGALSLAVLAVLWLPPIIDVIRHAPSNFRVIIEWFGSDDAGGGHTLAQGWRVMSAQFWLKPEWLTDKQSFNPVTGESVYMLSAPVPLLLALVAGAGVVVWQWGRTGRAFVATVVLTFLVGIVAVARTVGAAFDYRLRWTFVAGLLGLLLVAWAGWGLATRRWPRAERVLVPVALGGLAVVCAVNTATAATAGTPQPADSAAMNRIVPDVLAALPETDGQVVVDDGLQTGAWYARSLVLELERKGVRVAIPADRTAVYGKQRQVDPPQATVRVVITADEGVDKIGALPGLRRVAEWEAVPDATRRRLEADRERLHEAAGLYPTRAQLLREHQIEDALRGGTGSHAYRLAVFIDDKFPLPEDG